MNKKIYFTNIRDTEGTEDTEGKRRRNEELD